MALCNIFRKQNELVCGLSGAAQLVKLLDAPVNITGEVGALLSCTVLDHSQQVIDTI